MKLLLVLAAIMLAVVAPAHADPVSDIIGLTALIEGAFGGAIAGGGVLTIAGVSASAIGGFILGTAAIVALNVVSGILNKPKASSLSGSFDVQDGQAALQTASRVSVSSRSITMGFVLRSGTLFFEQVQGPYLYRGYILANHEIDGVEEVRVGTTKLTLDASGKANAPPYYDGSTVFLQVSIRTGTDDQQIDPILAADFPSFDRNFRQRGLATAVVKLYRGQTAAVASSIWGQSDPSLLFLVRGKRFFDPRDPSQSIIDISTWQFSNNAAVCTAGWLNDPDGGDIDWSFIDLGYLRVAADICDQVMLRKDGTTEPRYRIDGVADTAADPNQTLTDLITSMIGEYTMVAGKHAIIAGAPRETGRTLTESSARGTLDVTTERPWQDYINSVSTSFVAKDRDYTVATGPVYEDTDAIAADGTSKSTTIQLPFVTSDTQVQRISKYTIRRSQLGGSLQRGEDIEALRLTATDIVTIEYTGGLSPINGVWELIRLSEADRIDEYVLQLARYDGIFLFGWDPEIDERDWSQADINLSSQ